MSDDRVVSLKDRRSEGGPRLGGCLVFANDQLRMPMVMGAVAPEWTTIDPVEIRMDGRAEPTSVLVRFGMIDHSPDGTSGYVGENEHGVTAALYFERELFLAFQSAALSPAPLTLFVTFSARDDSPPNLMLAIERRTV
ncbi:hypothetical protein [Brevundimonas sp.]|uniref:hypothetical protein n=1 Tax=Brevundimonas sp. TaxID=1871086 RepID=UPI002D6F3FF7|nr:hypothetical protein [Brevundimonas sp.]HYC67666.1 hypothetical protein [Brevundimonas sp.]